MTKNNTKQGLFSRIQQEKILKELLSRPFESTKKSHSLAQQKMGIHRKTCKNSPNHWGEK
jgi:hypothetical protein